MKKHINLIVSQKKYYQIDAIIRYLRIAIMGFGVVFIVVNVVFFIILYKQNTNTESLLNQKKDLLEFLVENKESEARFIFFNTKEKQVATILKGDVNFYPYYNLLTDSLKSASPAGKLQSLLINKDRSVNFSIGFDDYPSLLSFFKFMETDAFLKNFNDLTLSSVETAKQDTKGSFVLNLHGTFKELL